MGRGDTSAGTVQTPSTATSVRPAPGTGAGAGAGGAGEAGPGPGEGDTDQGDEEEERRGISVLNIIFSLLPDAQKIQENLQHFVS